MQGEVVGFSPGKSNVSIVGTDRRVHLTEIAVYFRYPPRIWSMDIEINCVRSRLNFISDHRGRVLRHLSRGFLVQLTADVKKSWGRSGYQHGPLKISLKDNYWRVFRELV
ncbi:hypothetical protein WN48_06726 [Eufriesea mexicana]|uniref:Uncharacterized protein n=1 Tax=Eufriesea mexicana TaxID=516756 RepID=A0A310SC99_9HYME|nr:hypothetical protein WN48_06726 [Eufriesea mexicana]